MKPKSHHSIVAAVIPHHTDKDKILVFDHLKMDILQEIFYEQEIDV